MWEESERQGALGKDEIAKVSAGRGVRDAEQRAGVWRPPTAERGRARSRGPLGGDAAARWTPASTSRGAGSPSRARARGEPRPAGGGDAWSRRRGRTATPPAWREATARGRRSTELDALHDEALRLLADHGNASARCAPRPTPWSPPRARRLRATAGLDPYPPQVKRKRADLEGCSPSSRRSRARRRLPGGADRAPDVLAAATEGGRRRPTAALTTPPTPSSPVTTRGARAWRPRRRLSTRAGPLDAAAVGSALLPVGRAGGERPRAARDGRCQRRSHADARSTAPDALLAPFPRALRARTPAESP